MLQRLLGETLARGEAANARQVTGGKEACAGPEVMTPRVLLIGQGFLWDALNFNRSQPAPEAWPTSVR